MAVSNKAINFIQSSLERGRPIPGQSLTNSPDQPYRWEQPPEFTNPREAMLGVFEALTVPETTGNILVSLIKGVGVIDVASITLYSGFLEGKWNPDLMLMLIEPFMYLLMALAEKAGIEYRIDSEEDEDDLSILEETGKNIKEQVKQKTQKGVPAGALPKDIIEDIEQLDMPTESLLAKPEQEEPKSLLEQEK